MDIYIQSIPGGGGEEEEDTLKKGVPNDPVSCLRAIY